MKVHDMIVGALSVFKAFVSKLRTTSVNDSGDGLKEGNIVDGYFATQRSL